MGTEACYGAHRVGTGMKSVRHPLLTNNPLAGWAKLPARAIVLPFLGHTQFDATNETVQDWLLDMVYSSIESTIDTPPNQGEL